MGRETVWTLEIDGSGGIATLEAFVVAIQAATDAMATFIATASDLSAIDSALESVGGTSAVATDEIEGLNSVVEQLSTTLAEDNQIISGLNEQIANLEAQIAALTGEFDGAKAGAGGFAAALGFIGETAGSVGEALQAMQGPLLMISAAAIMAGKSLFDAGTQGQQGLALVQGMAGATNQDVANLEQSALALGDTMQQATSGFYEVASAGYKGGDAIEVFTDATKASKAGQADLQSVTSALTSEMAAYGAKSNEAKTYTDQMIEAVLVGKQSFDSFASAIGPLAATGHNVGLSFAEVASAEAALTQINPNVRQDANQLRFLFNAMDMSMDKVSHTAQSLGLNFDETHYASLNLIDKLKYLADISGGTTTQAFIKLTGGVAGQQAALALLANQGDTYTSNLGKIQHSQGATDAAFERSEQTVSAHVDKMSAAFSVFSTKLMDAVGPKLIPILDALASGIGKVTDFMTTHLDIMMPILAGLATALGVVLVTAIGAFIATIVGAAGPVLLVAAALGAVATGIAMLVTHWNQITSVLSSNPVFHGILSILQQIGSFIASSFAPVWQELVTVFQTQLVPAWNNLLKTLQPAIPAFEFIGAVIGGVLLIAIGELVATIEGLVGAFTGALSGIIQVVGGIVQIISGAVQTVLGIIGFFTDLLTGHFNKLGGDLGNIWGGIATMFSGVWNVISGIVHAAIGAISGAISGFISGIVGYFEGLDRDLGGVLSRTIGSIRDFISHALDIISGFFTSARDRVTGGLHTVVSAAKTGGGDLASWWHGLWNTLSHSPVGEAISKTLHDQLAPIGGELSHIGETLRTQLGNAFSSVLPALSNLARSFALVWQQIVQAAQVVGGAFAGAWKILQPALAEINQVLYNTLVPAFHAINQAIMQLVPVISGALMTAWRAIQPVLAQVGQIVGEIGQKIGGSLLAALEILGAVIGGVILIAISLLLGAIVGLAKGLASFISGIVSIITGFVSIFSGAIQIIAGITAFITDLLTGHFGKLSTDLGVIWNGIVTMFTGVWDVIKGVFEASIGTVIGFVQGLVDTVVDFFKNLYNKLVGHSIVIDLANDIVNVFQQLPGQLLNALASLPGMLAGLWNNIANDAYNAGQKVCESIAQAITNSVGKVTDAAHNLASQLSSFLPHSPAKEGPLKDLVLQGSMIPEQIGQGMREGMPRLTDALKQLTSPIALNLETSALLSPSLSTSSPGGDQATQYLAQIAGYLSILVSRGATAPGNLTMNNTIAPSPISNEAVNQLIQALSGYGYESVARGGY